MSNVVAVPKTVQQLIEEMGEESLHNIAGGTMQAMSDMATRKVVSMFGAKKAAELAMKEARHRNMIDAMKIGSPVLGAAGIGGALVYNRSRQ